MAKALLVEIIDDIDETPIDDGGEHIRFAVNGTKYELDLGETNAREFHRKLDYYIAHSTKRTTATAARAATPDPQQTKAVRDWARSNGYDVSDRGRVPAAVVDAFTAAH